MARKRGASEHKLVLTDSGRPSECTAREFTVSAKISNEVFESALYCSSGSNQRRIDSAAVCRFSGSKRGDSPFAVPLRPGSASQSLGQPFSMSSEPVFAHHSNHPGVMQPLIQEHQRTTKGCAVERGIEFSNRHELSTSYTAFSSDLGSWPHLGARGKDTGLSSKDSSKGLSATVGLGFGVGVGSNGADTGPASTDSDIPGPLALARWGST